jgi:hypothetical protein
VIGITGKGKTEAVITPLVNAAGGGRHERARLQGPRPARRFRLARLGDHLLHRLVSDGLPVEATKCRYCGTALTVEESGGLAAPA